jgi:hypothetical protein
MSDPPLPLEPDFDDLNDPFYRFVDNRHFYDVSEETQYLAERLVPQFKAQFDEDSKEVKDTAV